MFGKRSAHLRSSRSTEEHRSSPGQSIHSPQSPRHEFQLGSPLFQTSILTPVKLKGFLRLMGGESVTVLDTINGPRKVAFAQLHEEVGKVPTACLLLDLHCSNIYAAACTNIVLASPALLHLSCDDESIPGSLVDMLALRPGALTQALSTLVSLEVEHKRTRRLETETLRDDSAAVRLLRAVLQRPAVRIFNKVLCAGVCSVVREALNSSTSDEFRLLYILEGTVSLLKGMLETPVPELVTVIHAFQNGGAGHFCLSFLCLRCFVPSLTTCSYACETATPLVKAVAKALQLVGNNVDPAEESPLYPLRFKLKASVRLFLCSFP